ncbi:hypothetical protein ACFOVU_03275 [Nocardiopsis sediminis]|uniref:DUF7847 domain-containing protein n=1 Tax=Nocardiopsis sediminis TaxID=1778267 RepID=A0ABV8FHW5_9ACTN
MTQDDGQARRDPDRSPEPEPGAGGDPAPGPAPSSWAAPGGGAPEPPASSPGWVAPGGAAGGPGHDQGQGYGPGPDFGQQGYPPAEGQAPAQGTGPAFAPPLPPPGYAPPGAGGPAGYAPPGHGPHPGYGQYGQPPYGAPPGYGPPAAPRPGIVALRPLALGDIFNGAFGYIRNNPKVTLGMTAIIVALASLLPAIGAGSFISDYTVWLEESPLDEVDFPMSPFTLVAQFGGAILSFVGTAVLTGLLAAVVGLAVLGRRLSAGEAWAAVRPRLGAVLGVALLLLLLGVASFALLFGVVAGAVGLGVAGVDIWICIVAGLLGVLAWAAVNVWIYVRTSLAMPVTVLERVGPGGSLARSWRLTRRGWWRVFGILLLSSFLGNMVASVLSGPFSVIAAVAGVVENRFVADTIYAAAIFLGSMVAGTITNPFVTGVTTLLYVDLRMRREGLDLRLQAAAQSGADAGPEIYLPEPPAPAGPPPGPGYPQQAGYPQPPGPAGAVPGAPV